MKMKGILGRGQGKDLTKSKKISKMGLSSDAEVLEGVYLPLGVFTSTDWRSNVSNLTSFGRDGLHGSSTLFETLIAYGFTF